MTLNNKWLIPVSEVVPVFIRLNELSENCGLLSQVLKTMKILLISIYIQMGESIRTTQEYKVFSSSFIYFILHFPANKIKGTDMKLLQIIISSAQGLDSSLIPELYSTRKYWLSTSLEVQEFYWNILKTNQLKCIKKSPLDILKELLFDINCTLDSPNALMSSFIVDLFAYMDADEKHKGVLLLVDKLLNDSAKSFAYINRILIALFKSNSGQHVEIIVALHKKIVEADPSNDKLNSLELTDVITSLESIKYEVKKYVWRNVIKHLDFDFHEGDALEKHKEHFIKRAETVPLEGDLDELESKIMEEGIRIQSSIKRVKDIKDDFINTKQRIFTEESSSDVNEKADYSNKFSLTEVTSSVNPSNKLNEEQKYDKKVLSLTGNYMEAMRKLGAKQESIVDYFNKRVLMNESIIFVIGYILPKIVASDKFVETIKTIMTIGNLKPDIRFMKGLMKAQIKVFNNDDILKLQCITKLHSKLLLKELSGHYIPLIILEALHSTDNDVISDCIKGLWGFILKEFSKKQNKVSVELITELTFAILISTNKFKEFLFSFPGTTKTATYSNIELVTILFFDILKDYFKTKELKFTSTAYHKGFMPFIHCVSLMVCYVLEDSASDLVMAENWIDALRNILMSLMGSFNLIESEVAREDIILLVGFVLRKCVDKSILMEYSVMYKKLLVKVLNFIFGSESFSNIRKLYRNYFITVKGEYLVSEESVSNQEISEEMITEEIVIEFLEQNVYVAKELDRLSRDFIKIITKKIKNASHIEYLKLTEPKTSIHSNLKIMEEETMETLAVNSISSDQSIEQLISMLKREKRWIKAIKSAKGWQGFHRAYDLFANRNLPMKVSSHRFHNGLRCLLTLRRNPTTYYTENLNNLGGFDSSTFERLSIKLFSKTCTTHNMDKEIAFNLYQNMQKKLRDKLFEPIETEMFKGLHIAKGWLLIYRTKLHKPYLIFVWNEEREVEDLRSMFSKKLHSGIRYYRMRLSNIRKLVKHQIVDEKTGLEVVLYTGRTYLFHFFEEEKRDMIASKLVRLREKWCNQLQYDGSLDSIRVFEKKGLSDQWIKRQISSLDYLMYLNTYSSRSYDNLSQYLVFPWLVFEIENGTLRRDLSKNIGMVGDSERAEDYKKQIKQEDLTGTGHFHFGSHYSNPGIVLQFLMRAYPYFEGCLRFSNGLDDPNRMFHSIADTSHSCMKDASDVRELVPEFYSFPEIFLNTEKHRFGIRSGTGEVVDNVILPGWAGNAYKYVADLRELLEGEDQGKFEQWIDLVFGYLQRGKNAEKAFNLFPPITYDPSKILNEVKGNESLYNAYKMQAYHWGQIPQQLFIRKHKTRSVRICKSFWEDFTIIENIWKSQHKVTNILRNDDDTLIFINSSNGSLQSATINLNRSNIFSLGLSQQIPNKSKSPFNSLHPLFTSPISLIINRKPGYIVQAGYWDGSIQLTSLDLQHQISFILMYHRSAVIAMVKDKYERISIVSTIHGECGIYSLHENMFWKPESLLKDHAKIITVLRISNEMQLFITGSLDCTLNIYELDFKPKLMRTIYHGSSVDEALLFHSPISGVLVYSKTTSKLTIYSINGQLLVQMIENNMISPTVVESTKFIEYVIYAQEKKLIIRKLPFLELKVIELNKKEKIVEIFGCGKYLIVHYADNTISLIY